MKLVHINKVGTSGDLYAVREFFVPVDPGYGGGLPANPLFPDNSLPAGPPVGIAPNEVLVMIRDPEGVWHYAAIQPGSPPPRPLPEPPPPVVGGGPVMPPNMVTNPIAPGAAPKK